jgi:hypothetical protein
MNITSVPHIPTVSRTSYFSESHPPVMDDNGGDLRLRVIVHDHCVNFTRNALPASLSFEYDYLISLFIRKGHKHFLRVLP